MFNVTINGQTYKVKFRHNYEIVEVKDKETKATKQQKRPYRTTCIIINTTRNKVVTEGVACPIKEIAVLESNPKVAEAKYKRRLKRVYHLDTGEVVAILKGDMFSYDEGRKIALEKALDTFSKDDRVFFWHNYLTMGSKTE